MEELTRPANSRLIYEDLRESDQLPTWWCRKPGIISFGMILTTFLTCYSESSLNKNVILCLLAFSLGGLLCQCLAHAGVPTRISLDYSNQQPGLKR